MNLLEAHVAKSEILAAFPALAEPQIIERLPGTREYALFWEKNLTEEEVRGIHQIMYAASFPEKNDERTVPEVRLG